ncbi:MAG: hypothetical protein ACK2UT_04525 [Candidatus Promineifilaceae bacterium]
MKIVHRSTGRQAPANLFWLLLATGALLVGLVLGNAGAIPALENSWHNLQRRLATAAPSNELPVLTANIDFEDYNQLLSEREDALDKGVLMPDDSTFVPATIQQYGDQEIRVWIRLLPGTANHLGANDKWNFELVTRDDLDLLGTTHANLLDPADNNWVNQWAFLEALRHEGLPSGSYQFVQLILNGNDGGIYALQEDLRPLVTNENNQPGAVVLSYDIEPLLEVVSNYGDIGSAVADPVSNLAGADPRFLQVAEIDDPLVTDDELLSQQFERGTALLRGLQSGELAASEVFDAQQYGRFLALVDLWGASNALSPFYLHYIYNSELDRLQPLVTNANPLAGDFRLPPEAMYQDAGIQAAYASAVAEISSAAYLSNLRSVLGDQYADLEHAMVAEIDRFPIWDELAARQELLQLSLHPAQPIIAQLGSPDLAQEAIIRVNVANALNLPLEVLGFDIDGATFLPVNPEWIVAGEAYHQTADERIILDPIPGESAGLRFVTFDLPVTEIIRLDDEIDFLNEIEIQVATSVLGIDDQQMTPASPGLNNGG